MSELSDSECYKLLSRGLPSSALELLQPSAEVEEERTHWQLGGCSTSRRSSTRGSRSSARRTGPSTRPQASRLSSDFSGDLAGHATAAEALVQPWPHIDPEPELLDAALAQRQWR